MEYFLFGFLIGVAISAMAYRAKCIYDLIKLPKDDQFIVEDEDKNTLACCVSRNQFEENYYKMNSKWINDDKFHRSQYFGCKVKYIKR